MVSRRPAMEALALARDLAALIDHLGFADVRLVAQSMGGWTCLGYALRAPARVRALVMACTTGSLSAPETDAIFAARPGARPEADLAARGIHPACGERSSRKRSISWGVGGRPMRSNVRRRIKVRRSAGGDNDMPRAESFARTKASIAVAAPDTAGTAGILSGCSAQ